MCTIYVAEQHDQVLDLWRKREASSLNVLHLDFHCDMRGLLINRRDQLAYRIPDFVSQGVDEGNFLTHAILEGRVRSLRWVHDEPGGRRYDVGTVKYESDFSALPYRLLMTAGKRRGIPLDYSAIKYSDWRGLGETEFLDIDWDFFAGTEYPEDTIQSRVESFLMRGFSIVPREVYVCYSPDYCYPSRLMFERFVSDLAKGFNAGIVELPPLSETPVKMPIYKRYMPSFILRAARNTYHRAGLKLRGRGIY